MYELVDLGWWLVFFYMRVYVVDPRLGGFESLPGYCVPQRKAAAARGNPEKTRSLRVCDVDLRSFRCAFNNKN